METTRLVFVVSVLLVGCSGEVPTDKQPYIGTWKSNAVTLLITPEGDLSWEQTGVVGRSIPVPIKEFTETKIIAGVLFLTTEFSIDEPAQESQGIWSVTVNGFKLYKTNEFGLMPQATIVPKRSELKRLVEEDLKLLAWSIRQNNFAPYIANASRMFQYQFDNEKMKQTMSTFIARKVDIEQYMVGKFVLTKDPTISNDGVLSLEGKYLEETRSFTFLSKFLYAHPEWKSLGANVTIGSQ